MTKQHSAPLASLPIGTKLHLLLSLVRRPSIQFSDDETVAGRCVTNEVHLFDPQDFSRGIVDKLRVPGVAAMQLGFDPPSHIACFVPEHKVRHLASPWLSE